MDNTNPITPLDASVWLALAALVLPLLSFLVNGLFYKKMEKASGIVGTLCLAGSTVLGALVFGKVWFSGAAVHATVALPWFALGNGEMVTVTAGVLINDIAAVMLCLVPLVSLLVHLYSTAYLRSSVGRSRYFAFLGLFSTAMLGLVLANNLLLLFVCWELVGFCSYLLIGYWFTKDTAAQASKKAFVVNRIGDAGLLLALMVCWNVFGTFDLDALREQAVSGVFTQGQWLFPGSASLVPAFLVTLLGVGFMMGAIGKSAQFPLQLWLPDAMAGPTPVSALIHAATMVAAGVYLLARVFFLFNLEVLTLLAVVGSVTAFLAAFAAFGQHDIKKVLAYSTISQLGYMVMGIGVGAYDAALFHLLTHAFFKACLFLSAGSVIHAMSMAVKQAKAQAPDLALDAQDMRLMGGLSKAMPFTYVSFTLSALALAGLPGFSGFLSKDAILAGALGWAEVQVVQGGVLLYVVPLLGFVTALLTVLYIIKVLLLVFWGDMRLARLAPGLENAFTWVKEVPRIMWLPSLVLGVLSVGFVYSLVDAQGSWFMKGITVPSLPLAHEGVLASAGSWLGRVQHHAHDFHTLTTIVAVAIGVSGLALGWLWFKPKGRYETAFATKEAGQSFVGKLSTHHWYLDLLGMRVVVPGIMLLAKLARALDRRVIDPVVEGLAKGSVLVSHVGGWFDRILVDGAVNGLAYLAGQLGHLLRSLQNGKIQSYLAWIAIVLVLIMFYMIS